MRNHKERMKRSLRSCQEIGAVSATLKPIPFPQESPGMDSRRAHLHITASAYFISRSRGDKIKLNQLYIYHCTGLKPSLRLRSQALKWYSDQLVPTKRSEGHSTRLIANIQNPKQDDPGVTISVLTCRRFLGSARTQAGLPWSKQLPIMTDSSAITCCVCYLQSVRLAIPARVVMGT